MDTTWILVADSGRARIFEKHNHAAITELQDLTNSLGRLQDRELKTDKKGRFFDALRKAIHQNLMSLQNP